VDQVHGAVNRWRSSGPCWIEGSADKRHGSASPVLAGVGRGGRGRRGGAGGRLTGARVAV
jgi:hypothetical protein